MKWRKRALGILVLVLILAGLVYAFMPSPPTVTVAAAAVRPMSVTVEQEGRTRVRDRYVVSAPVAGEAGRIDLDVGDAVGAGDVLTRIAPMTSNLLDPRSRARARAQVESAEAAVKAAEAGVTAAEARSRQAATELSRVKALYEKGIETDQALDIAQAADQEARATLRSAVFQARVSRAELASARTMLARYDAGEPAESIPVKAPVAGRVLGIRHESAGPVEPGTPLIEIGDPRAIEVATDVLSSDAVRIAPGMPVTLRRWGGDQDLRGQVTRVEPTAFTKVSALGVEEQRVWVISSIVSPRESWGALGDGYSVDCSFILWSGDEVLQVPDSAVFDSEGGSAVFVVEEGRARLRSVKVGRRSGLDVQILEGLAAGEVVITHPDESVSDGGAVKVRGQPQ